MEPNLPMTDEKGMIIGAANAAMSHLFGLLKEVDFDPVTGILYLGNRIKFVSDQEYSVPVYFSRKDGTLSPDPGHGDRMGFVKKDAFE